MFGSFCGRSNPPPRPIQRFGHCTTLLRPFFAFLSLSLSVAAYCSAGVVRVHLSRTISLFSQSDFRGSRHLLGALTVKIFSSLLRNTCPELTHLSSGAGVGGFRSLWGPAPEFFDVTRRADIIHRLYTSRMTAKETEQEDRLKLSPFCIVQELCESRGGRPELSVLTSLLVSVDGIGLSLSLICQLTSEDIKHHFIIIIFPHLHISQ